jgi:hypothetical protein
VYERRVTRTRDYLELHEAAWVLQLSLRQARRVTSWDAADGTLERLAGTGGRVKVGADSVRRLAVGRLAQLRLAQLLRYEIVAPKPSSQGAAPEPLVSFAPEPQLRKSRARVVASPILSSLLSDRGNA